MRVVLHSLWLCLLLCIGTVYAADPIATVIASRGEVVATNTQGQPRILQRRALLYLGDTLKTPLDGRLQFRLLDGTVFTLGERTTFVLREFEYQSAQTKNSLLFEMSRGVFRAVTGAITQQPLQRFEIKTPVATLGVRGTDFWGGFLFSAGLDVLLIDGSEVYVQNQHGTTLLQQSGLGTTVMPNAAPNPSKQWPSNKVQQAQNSVAF